MFERQISAKLVVDNDRADGFGLQFAADHRRGNAAAFFEVAEQVDIEKQPVGQHDQAFHAAVEQHFQIALEAAALVVNIGQDRQVRSLIEGIFDSAQYQRAVGIGHVENHDADRVAALAAQGTSKLIRPVPQALRGAFDFLFGGGRNVAGKRRIVEDDGDRGGRKSALFGDISNRDHRSRLRRSRKPRELRSFVRFAHSPPALEIVTSAGRHYSKEYNQCQARVGFSNVLLVLRAEDGKKLFRSCAGSYKPRRDLDLGSQCKTRINSVGGGKLYDSGPFPRIISLSDRRKNPQEEAPMKRILKIIGIVIIVLIIIVIAIPFFVNANDFRPKLESELSNAMGRKVTVGNLSLSILSGGISADNIAIGDDPAFSQTPFVQAKSLSVGVELLPLIFSKTLNVTELTLNEPQISLVKSQNGEKWNFSSLGNSSASSQANSQSPPTQPGPATQPPPEQKPSPQATNNAPSSNPNLSVAKFNVKDGSLTVSQVGSSEKPHVYDKVNITITNFSFNSSFPFKMTANLPGGGSLNLDGNAGPISASDASLTPLNAKVTVKNMDLAQSGFIDPASGIAGVADFDGTVTSDGHDAKTNGTLKVSDLKVSPKGTPAGQPVDVNYTAVYDLQKQTGSIPQCDVSMGKAVAHVTGTYDLHGQVTSIDMKLNGDGMPVDDLEAMLPALGVVLPPKASLKGGDLNVNTTTVGPVDKLVTTGAIKLQNTALANFDLGSKLSSISALAGKQTGSDTAIKNFSSDVRVAPEGTQASNINLDVPSIGVLTGGGTVSPSNQLAFKMDAQVAGLTVPFGVGGTTSDPKFTPDVKGMATGLLKNALGGKGKQNPLGGLSGLFGKKKPQ